jgi:anti-anti-sigma factor
MNSNFEESTGKLKIALTGDLIGGADAMKFSVTLREALLDKNMKHVDVDASGVGFVNSSGLGMLIAARQAVQEHGAEFRLQKPGEQLKSLLNITKLTELLGAS